MVDQTVLNESLAVKALISGFELDLRDIISAYVADANGGLSFLGNDFFAERKVPEGASVIDWLYIGEAIDILNSRLDSLHLELQRDFKEVINLQSNAQNVQRIRKNSGHSREIQAFADGDLANIFPILASLESADFVRTIQRTNELKAGALSATISSFFPPIQYCLNNLPPKDYADTTLMGRRSELNRLVDDLMNPYFSVVSIIAPGGVGKTALALEAAYTLASKKETFDLVLWHSAKTERWTTQGAVFNENVETDLHAAFANFGKVFDPEFSGTVDDFLELIGDSPTLVILDNFETYTGSDFQALIRKFPRNSRIKILITSRRGIGSNESRFELAPLLTSAAIAFLLKLARLRNVPSLVSLRDEARTELVQDFLCKPLDLKWFVECLAAGKTIQEIRASKADLMAFCVETVMQALSPLSRRIIANLSVSEKGLPLAHLHLLLGTSLVEELTPSIHELLQSGVVKLHLDPSDPNVEVVSLSEVSSVFLDRSTYFSNAEKQEVKVRQAALQTEFQSGKNANSSLTNPFNIFKRDDHDNNAHALLTRAMTIASKDMTKALAIVQDARNARRGYFEVDRVEAFLKAKVDPAAASRLYEKALEDADEGLQKALVSFHFADCLGYTGQDERALALATYANELIKSPQTKQQLGNFYVRNGDYEIGCGLLEEAAGESRGKTHLHAVTKLAKALERWADSIYKTNSEFEDAVFKLTLALDVMNQLWKVEIYDAKAMATYCNIVWTGLGFCLRQANVKKERIEQVALMLLNNLDILSLCVDGLPSDNKDVVRLHEKLGALAELHVALKSKLVNLGFEESVIISDEDASELLGIVRNLNLENGFGFVETSDGQQYFLSRRDLESRNVWSTLQNAQKVKFKVDPESLSNIMDGKYPTISSIFPLI